LAQLVEFGEGPDVCEADRRDLRALFLVLAERRDGLRVRNHEPCVLRGAVRVDGSADCADQRECEVEQSPLERRLADDRDRVALANARCEEAVRQLLDGARSVVPRDWLPSAVALHEERGRRPIRRDGVEPETADRSRLRNEALGAEAHNLRHATKRSGGAQRGKANKGGPSTIEVRMRTIWN